MTDGQQEEIERLFRTYADGIGSYLAARLGDAELAEELTSRVFMTVVRHYSQMRQSPAGWLWSIVRTELFRHYREQRGRRTAPREPAFALSGDVIEQRETQQQLHAALETLSEDEQQIVYMKFFQGMSNQEIAEAAGLNASNVGVIVFRTLRRLRGLMETAGTRAAKAGQ